MSAGSITLYLVVEVLFLVGILAGEFADAPGVYRPLMWASVLLNAAVALFLFIRSERRCSAIPLLVALLLTALADFFLAFLDAHYATGVACFCLVQLAYYLHIRRRMVFYSRRRNARGPLSLTTRDRIVIAALLLSCALTSVLPGIDASGCLAPISYILLIANVVGAFSLSAAVRKTGDTRGVYILSLFFLGLILFLACDTCVGLRNAASYIASFPSELSVFASYLIWIFYLPSQVLLTLSYAAFLRSNL